MMVKSCSRSLNFEGGGYNLAAEGGEDKKLDAVLVKRTTGNDTLKGRNLYQDPFDFRPTHVVFFSTNYRPRVSDSTESIWDRLRLIPFLVRFVDEDDPDYGDVPAWRRVDRLLPEKLRAELSGILAWMVKEERPRTLPIGCRPHLS